MSAETQCMKFRVCMNSEHTVNRVRAFDFARKTFNGGNEIVANKMENLGLETRVSNQIAS